MKRLKCSRCLYFDICSGKNVCKYFYSIDEDEQAELEIQAIEQGVKDDYKKAWLDYISECSDFNFDYRDKL